ncbi:MAG: M28 family peptidase [Candidatus Lokiarchaeota archaeon]|nr:M28 family peptidase [Candidatus Lokiarchaeota archaeon]
MFDNNYMHKFIEDICNDIGPRESGTEQEILAGNRVESELKKFCDETHQEEYISSPHAFLGGIRYGALLVFIAGIFFWLSLLIDFNVIILNPIFDILFLIIAIVLIVVTISYFILEVMKYHETFDFLFPKRESKNIIGTINPKDEVKNTVIFSAHHDSAFEFNTFYYLKRFGQITINVGYLGVGIMFIAIILKLIYFIMSIENPILFLVFGIIFIGFIPIILVYVFFHSYKPVLGAFDNLSGVSVLLGIAKFLSENKNSEEIFPKYTRVHLISFAGEEAGLRGAKRYVKAHYDELVSNQTTVVNMDSIAKKDFIVIHNKESGIGVKHDPIVFESLFEIAKNLNLNAKLLTLPFGATDGAVFSKNNIPTAAIGGLNLKEELAPYYHTRNDTPAVVEKEALGQFAQVCVEYLKLIDNQN